MPAFHKLPEAIYLLRRQRGMTGKDVAQAAGVSEAMFSGYQSGERVPSLLTLGKLLDALGASLTDLDSILEQLKSGIAPSLGVEELPVGLAGGVCVAGHVVTGAEAENLRQLLRAAVRLGELGGRGSKP